MPKTKICTTPEQLATLNMLRVRLAEKGYAIVPVDRCFRRNEQDFFAVSEGCVEEHLLIRPTVNSTVVVRPFAGRGISVEMSALLESVQKHSDVPIKFCLPQFRYWQAQLNSVFQCISPEGREELTLLGCMPAE